jgi:hypothetical protein
MNYKTLIGLGGLILFHSALAPASEQDALLHAVDSARITLGETAHKLNLLLAEIDSEALEAMPNKVESSVPDSETMPEVETTPAEAPVMRGTVERSVFTSNIENREPVDELQRVDPAQGTVYFFTELMDFQGQEVWHRWIYQGEVMAEVVFQVDGSRWRVHSSKNLMPQWTGEWKVDVVDGSGNVLASRSIEVVPTVVEEEPASANP